MDIRFNTALGTPQQMRI